MPNNIILRGSQYTRRELKSSEAIAPGELVEVDSGLLRLHSTSAGTAAPNFALQADYVGQGVGTDHTSGDRVPYAACASGVVLWAHLASGQDVSKGSYLMSNGAGFLTAFVDADLDGVLVAKADEDADASSGIGAGGSLRFRAEVV